MNVEAHLDIKKVATRDLETALRISKLQGQWTTAKSLQHQAELLGVEGPIMRQFEVHIERVEQELQELGAVTDLELNDPSADTEGNSKAQESAPTKSIGRGKTIR